MTRARLVSAAVFGAAAALVVVAVLLASPTFRATRIGPMSATAFWAPLAFGAPAALVGALAGPRVGAASSAGVAAGLGVGVTVASVAVYVLAVFALGYAFDIADGPPVNSSAQELLAPELWGVVLVGALVLSPLGALGAVVARRWIRQGAPPERAG